MYFNHAFRKMFVGTHADAVEAYAGGAGTALTQAGIDEGFITSTYTVSGGPTRIHSSDLQSYGMGPGTFAFFDPTTYNIVNNGDLSGCCPLVLASASIRLNDKLTPNTFHGGYQESNKSKLINPKYVREVYRVDPCTPQQAVLSIGTTPYTSQTVGAVTTETLLAAGTTYVNGTTYATTGGTGSGCTVAVTTAGAPGPATAFTVVDGGIGYTAGDVLTLPGGTGDATFTVNTITPAIDEDATCCKEYLCGESYYLRIDVKGSPALRALNHNSYYTVDYNTGCCASEVPTAVDPTLVYLAWAKQIVDTAYLKDFIAPVVFDYTGVAWYAPGTTVTLDGTATAVTAAQWWGPNSADPTAAEIAASPGYEASVQGLAWTDECTAGMRLYGAFVETTFGNCSFQTTDHYETEPLQIYASLVDYTGDPCVFEGLCVYKECGGVMGQGFGETVLRDLILSESYLQNFRHTDPRIREITGGDDINAVVTRATRYYRYVLEHSVPRFNNPTGTFDNDRYLLEIVTRGQNASLETFLETWLETGCSACSGMATHSCTACEIVADAATA